MGGMDNNISKGEWSKYFMEILEGKEKERTEEEKLQVKQWRNKRRKERKW